MDETSTSSDALERLRAAESSSGPASTGPEETPRARSDPSRSDRARSDQDRPTDAPITPPAGGEQPDAGRPGASTAQPETSTAQPERDRAAEDQGTRLRHARRQEPRDVTVRVNDWLDSLGEPDWDEVSEAIYESPARARAAYHAAQERREEARVRRAQERQQRAEFEHRERIRAEAERIEAELAAERERIAAERAAAEAARREAERIEAERRREAERIEAERRLEIQRAEEEALRAEQERQEAEAWLAWQQERETWALQTISRDRDGTSLVPPPDRRPLMEQRGEDLTDEQLLERARHHLPEFRRRHRIMEKAQAIETAAIDSADDPPVETAVVETPRTYIPPYNLPSREPDPRSTGTDALRRLTVTGAWLAFVAGGLWGLGWLGVGGGLPQAQGERWSGDFSLLSMAAWHEAIWPALWLGLGVHVVHQWLPSQSSAARQRETGWRLAAAMVGTVAWFGLVQLGTVVLETLVWLTICYLLVDAVHQLNLYTARARGERVITDGMIGLFTGWAVIFATTNVSVTLQALGVNLFWIPGVLWAVLTLIVVIWGTAMLAMTERGRITIALAMAWGLAALLVPRLVGDTTSVWVAIVAAMGAFVVLLATENRRYRINHAEHRAALGHESQEY